MGVWNSYTPRIGMGLRLSASIKTKKGGIDLGSLLNIGFAAKKNDLAGTLVVRAMGITSQEILLLLPGMLPTVDESAIISSLEAMAAVKAKFYDDNTTLSPRILAINLDDQSEDPMDSFLVP